MTRKEHLIDFYRKNCIKRPETGYFLGKLPGARYSSQWYSAPALYNQDMLFIIGAEFAELVRQVSPKYDFQLAGRDWSAIPLLTYLPTYLATYRDIHINSFLIRSERKTYGMHNIVEGIPNDKPVLLVDDLLNSTNSFVYCANIVRNELKLPLVSAIFAPLNKYRPSQIGPSAEFDRYLGQPYKALYIMNGDDFVTRETNRPNDKTTPTE